MRIEARLEKLERQTYRQELKIIVGTNVEMKEFQSMGDETFFKETGIDRAAYDLNIYVTDKYGE